MTVKNEYIYIVPVVYLTAIFNDDPTALNAEDIVNLDTFLNEVYENKGDFVYPDNVDNEKYFSHSNDVDKYGNDVIKLRFICHD